MSDLRKEILELAKKYYETELKKKPYHDGDAIHYASRVFDEKELVNLIDSALDFWLTSGRYCNEFEHNLSSYLKVKVPSLLVNSGSSANLVAFMALTSTELGDRAIKRGDEVITVACGFPTTVTPIINFGAVPVFCDITIPQYNIDVSQLEQALSNKTKAVMIAHTLGNPFDLKAVKDFCIKHNLWLIEDNCDALGSKYIYNDKEYFTGTIGDIGTSSFYPPHHMTMGEGGAVYTNNPVLYRLCKSFRDWGRDCVCPSGMDNFCGHRFSGQYGELPYGYDHKYVYSHFGYNLKVTDMQGAIGVAQLEKFPSFVEKRIHNWKYLFDKLSDLKDKIILPEACPNSKPSWFGFVITCKEGVSCFELTKFLEKNGVQTRKLFAGNLLRHPCFDEMRKSKSGYRVIGDLKNTDYVMNNTFRIGVYPGMEISMLDRMSDLIHEYFK